MMKKILASIVEYKLNQKNLGHLLQIISTTLNSNTSHPIAFKVKLLELLNDIILLADVDDLSEKEKSLLMSTLTEMEMLIVEYLRVTKSRR
jgi:hypothetical protein